jgi:transposase-like protein
VLRQKAAEIALKLNTEFTLLKGWCDQFRKYAGLSYRPVSEEFKRVTEEEVAKTTSVLYPVDQEIISSLKHKYCSHLV